MFSNQPTGSKMSFSQNKKCNSAHFHMQHSENPTRISFPTLSSLFSFFTSSTVYVISCMDSNFSLARQICGSTLFLASNQLIESCSMLCSCFVLSESLVWESSQWVWSLSTKKAEKTNNWGKSQKVCFLAVRIAKSEWRLASYLLVTMLVLATWMHKCSNSQSFTL